MATESDKLHAEAMEEYEAAIEQADENRNSYIEDHKFSRLSEQWPEEIKRQRSTPGKERPMITVNRLPAFGRQVVNDIRQNRPQIKVRPADSSADVTTALVLSGLIRNIEHTSNAGVAYDTAAECAVFGGFGYWRIDVDYACDDSFDQDIKIKRIANPLSVVPDPWSTEADSSDWNVAFVCTLMSKEQFADTYPDADPISFNAMSDEVRRNWTDGDDVLVAEYWKRRKVMKTILRLSNNLVIDAEDFEEDREILTVSGVTVTGQREVETYKVKQCILNGQEVLTKRAVIEKGKQVTKPSYDWPGKYIPIIPVYGDEINDQGKRLFRSMIHDAKDAQRQVNYWETTATELVALAPRVPFIGPKGAFKTDKNWAHANTQNLPFLEYDGPTPPQRMQVDSGPALGAMAQARQAGDNMKAVLGMYDASLGARSNETSGKAIQARQREGDVSQFHFTDNLMRSVTHSGRVILDLIPKIYTKERIVRVLGDDGQAQNIKLGERQVMGQEEPTPGQPSPYPQGAPPPRIGALEGVFDLAMGKYDLVVEAGPSYTTQRQETAAQIGEFLRAFPQAAPVVGDILVKNFDWKDADEISRRLHKLLPDALRDEAQSPELVAAQQQIAAMTQQLQQLMAELEKERMDGQAQQAKAAVDLQKVEVEKMKVQVEAAQVQVEAQRVQNETRAMGVTEQGANDQTAVVNGVAQLADTLSLAAQSIAVATQQIAAASQGLQTAVAVAAAPKMKRVEMVRNQNGGYSAQVVEESVQ